MVKLHDTCDPVVCIDGSKMFGEELSVFLRGEKKAEHVKLPYLVKSSGELQRLRGVRRGVTLY